MLSDAIRHLFIPIDSCKWYMDARMTDASLCRGYAYMASERMRYEMRHCVLLTVRDIRPTASVTPLCKPPKHDIQIMPALHRARVARDGAVLDFVEFEFTNEILDRCMVWDVIFVTEDQKRDAC